MATASYILPATVSDDASWRAAQKFISDILTAGGVTKTADTGQIDFTSVNRPAAGNSAGYEIRHFTDDLQATHPIFLKIEYRSDNNTNACIVHITFGKGSDGSGNLTSAFTSTMGTDVGSSSAPASGSTSYGCVLPGFIGLMLYKGDNNAQQLVYISRSADIDGVATGDGIEAISGKGSSGRNAVYWNYASGSMTRDGHATVFGSGSPITVDAPPVTGGTTGVGPGSGTVDTGDTMVGMVQLWDGARKRPASGNFFMGMTANFTDLQELVIKHRGADVPVKAFHTATGCGMAGRSSGTMHVHLMRWE